MTLHEDEKGQLQYKNSKTPDEQALANLQEELKNLKEQLEVLKKHVDMIAENTHSHFNK